MRSIHALYFSTANIAIVTTDFIPLQMNLIPVSQRWKYSLIAFAFISAGCSPTAAWQKAAERGAPEDRLMADITYLADDKLKGRAFGTKGETKAGEYIANRFELLKLKPLGENGTWFQSFSVKTPTPHGVEFDTTKARGSLTGRNVIAFLDHKADYTIVLGAHYDHLGLGEMGSLHMGEPAIHNGADDNASGVALIMELAEQLKELKNYNYLFIAFTGEENGLWGSNYYCDHPTINLSSISAMLNFDMVGRLDRATRKMAANGVGTSPVWPELLKMSNKFGLDITSTESGIGPSDHTSFYLENIPVVHFFTGAHEDYHKPTDDVHLINPEGISRIGAFVVEIIRNMNAKNKLAFTKTKDPDPSSTPKMEVTLGVLPDYLYDGKGMRIEGVREGKPAHAAGLMKGDIIVKMANKDVRDIYAYMEVLGTFKKGDKTKLTAIREGKEIEFDINF